MVQSADLLAGYVTIEVPKFPPEVINNLSAAEYLTKLSVPIGDNNVGRTVLIKSGNETVKSIALKGGEVSPLSVILPGKYRSSDASFASLSATFSDGEVIVPPGSFDFDTSYDYGPLTANYQKVFTQGLSIDTKGLINVNFSDGSKTAIGSLAIATFAYEPGLRPVGDTNFAQSVESGDPIMTEAGAPAAGDIRSGMLEESNVDMTAELMQMLRAQQVYNGNARMMQTSVEMISRIVDKI
jgi:flagellar hook-basal body protein